MKRIFILVFVALFAVTGYAQKSIVKKITIQTNGVCTECKKIMMENVPQWNGVRSCTYDMNSSKLTIVYDEGKTDANTLRANVSKLGYDADHIKANDEARAKLPACCRVPKYQEHHCGSGCSHGSSGGCNHGGKSSGGCNHKH